MKKPISLRIYLIFFVLSTLIINSNVKNNCKRVRESKFEDEVAIRKFLCQEYEERATDLCNKQMNAEWEHSIDLDDKNKTERAMQAAIDLSRFDEEVYHHYLKDIDLTQLNNHDITRQVKKLFNIGYGALRNDLLLELTKILTEMQDIYSQAKICPYKSPKCNVTTEGIPLSPDIENIMANSPDFDELLYTWIAWHDATGAKVKTPFEFYVVLANEAATANNFSDRGEMWRSEYETNDFEQDVDRLWREVEPLYVDLHTYVRYCINEAYNKDIGQDDDDGLIPAHLLGNMWGQNWINIKGLVTPYPNDSAIDLKEAFEENNMTVPEMFDMANNFFVSMGLKSMEDAYDTKKGAIIEKSNKKSMICHASAWDFCNGTDFKVKMCAQKTFEDFLTIHHELGHIQYYMWYRYLPILYRSGANPAFHEAIGDMMALSVITPRHFQTLNIIDKGVQINRHQRVNMLMDMALVKIAFLPFGYMLDKWRWDVFAERIDPDKWNEHYWYYKMKYQRIKAPIVRSGEDFDAGAKYHICADTPYISYFIAHILEFQIHKALCNIRSLAINENEETKTIHDCDLQGNHLAGQKLRRALKMGASRHWTYILKALTGENFISTQPILEYFEPLREFLKAAIHERQNLPNKKKKKK